MTLCAPNKCLKFLLLRKWRELNIKVSIELPEASVGTKAPDDADGAHKCNCAVRPSLVVYREARTFGASDAPLDALFDGG